jgi:septum formation protein
LLRNAGIPFTAQPSDIDEQALADESPRDCALRLAKEKALSVSYQRPEDLVLGADTIVVIDDVLLGKPRDARDAARMLRLLSGRAHSVITGVCLIVPRNPESTSASKTTDREMKIASESTLVTMRHISDDEIRDYVATGEPMDKAGAYAIQGIASRWIPRIEGDYSNVVGLPVALVYAMLRECKAL